jgi:hypothetical protein
MQQKSMQMLAVFLGCSNLKRITDINILTRSTSEFNAMETAENHGGISTGS